MSSAERNRHFLIDEMEYRYLQRSWTDQELADELGTDRTNVWKIRVRVMQEQMGIPFIKEGHGRYRIDSTYYVSHIRLNEAEALALYLGGRRLQQQTRTGQRDVARALSKLSSALRKPLAEQLTRAAEVILEQEQDERQSRVLQTLLEAWVNNRMVHIKHRKAHGQLRPYTVAPYQLEPSVWGDGIYLIGYSEYHKTIASFKVARIEHATVTTQPFTIPDDFDGHKLLQHAWGIWQAEGQKTPVRLQFTPFVTPRVKETIWHPDQTITDLEDGGCIWQAAVAEWREMLPWVRGWGADVAVLEPADLREEVKGSVVRLARQYDLVSPTNATDRTTRLLRLWGKTDRSNNPEAFHPALYHMLDVAHVAQQLLSPRATPRWRQVLGRALGAEAETLHEWLPYLIALHDIGKLSAPFQLLNSQQADRLREEGFEFGRAQPADGRLLHHTITGRLLLDEKTKAWPPALREAFLDMVSGHHGIYRPEYSDDRPGLTRIKEPSEWAALRQQADRLLQSYLCQQWPDPLPEPANLSAAIVALNGFCILCDWLGSDEDYFKPRPNSSLTDYLLHSRQQAYQRVQDAGFFHLAISEAPTSFAQLFAFAPRPLQDEIDQIPADILAEPTLTIIEAPTGEGKTEAALALARRIAALRGTDEMYIALPTTATSNAMHKRIQTHLEKRLGLPPQLIQLVHGQSFLAERDDLAVTPLLNGDETEQFALDWFAPKKKALLAPFGVGTVDQVELAALNVRHNALRLIGLAGKVVILDEVHAYDTYMTTIIKRMLSWLAALGSSVILLSATLPSAKRQELAEAFSGAVAEELDGLDAYPNLLTVGTAVYTPPRPIAVYQPDKTITLNRLAYTDDQAQEKANWLLDQVQAGGCVCWLTNTVNRAQAIYQALQTSAPPDVDLLLLHGRFPLAERENLEAAIMDRYGPTGSRPGKGIVVGTQVLEQSLDLDFDLMATDLAPIDLILQRAGRLHRHERDKASRHTHTTAHLYLNMVIDRADKYIYSEYILRMTENVLADRSQISLPVNYRPLIEAVYTTAEPDKDDPLYVAWHKLDGEKYDLECQAEQRLANKPLTDRSFHSGGKLQGFKEDEDSSAWVVAQTRWGQESVTVIPLMRDGDNAHLLAAKPLVLPCQQKAARKDQLALLRFSIRVSHQTLVKYFKSGDYQKEIPRLFTQSALLKHTVPLWLEPTGEEGIFVNRDLPKPVCLHPQLGLVFGVFDLTLFPD